MANNRAAVEKSVGISEYFNNFSRYDGVIKSECKDFIVKEVIDDHVFDESPKVDISRINAGISSLNDLCGTCVPHIKSEEDILSLYEGTRTAVNARKAERAQNPLGCRLNSHSKRSRRSRKGGYKRDFDQMVCIYKSTMEDKVARLRIHNLVKMHPLLISWCDAGCIYISYTLENLYSFTLRKEDRDTTDVANTIGRILGRKVTFSGSKDRKAITYQRMCTSSDFLRLYECKVRGCEIMDIRQCNGIRLGDHDFNKFTIMVRWAGTGSAGEGHLPQSEDVQRNLLCMKDYRFINYFGLQRFGKYCNNHIVGEMIVKGDYSSAFDVIMSNHPDAYHEYTLKNYSNAKKILHPRNVVEKAILSGREEGADDFRTLRKIPGDMLMIYLHAYQSFLFNKEVSEMVSSGAYGDEAGVSTDRKGQSQGDRLDTLHLDLRPLNNRMCRGGKRSVIQSTIGLKISPQKEGVLVDFTLPKSAFATMALREIFNIS